MKTCIIAIAAARAGRPVETGKGKEEIEMNSQAEDSK
jgi:hypothetical protein